MYSSWGQDVDVWVDASFLWDPPNMNYSAPHKVTEVLDHLTFLDQVERSDEEGRSVER